MLTKHCIRSRNTCVWYSQWCLGLMHFSFMGALEIYFNSLLTWF